MSETPEERFDRLGKTETYGPEKPAKAKLRILAGATKKGARGPRKPEIRLIDAELPRIVDEAQSALIKADLGIYQRGGAIVRPISVEVPGADGRTTFSSRIALVSATHLAEMMTKTATFVKFDPRKKQWRAVSCPPRIAETYVARMEWDLPVLTGTISAPTLRSDGTILCRPGYDPQTGLLFDPQGVVFPPVPDRPTRSEAKAALDQLTEPVRLFPYVSAADRSVVISAMMTGLVRPSLPSAPIYCYDAPAAGTGKSMLADAIAIVITGTICPVSSQGAVPEELNKHLAASLICGDVLLCIDNIERPLGGDLLCQMLTQRTVRLRPLGTSVTLDLPTTITVMATGNNLVIKGDLVRRALVCRLDAQTERPELREFNFSPIQTVTDNRPTLVSAGLTIMRAYIAAGRPNQGPPLGSFEEWCRMVRDPLLWLGEADPTSTIERTRASDSTLRNLAAVLEQWEAVIGTERITASALIDRAVEQYPGYRDAHGFIHPELREALLAVAAEKGGGLSAARLGYWLRANVDKVAGGRRVVQDEEGLHAGRAWRCERIS